MPQIHITSFIKQTSQLLSNLYPTQEANAVTRYYLMDKFGLNGSDLVLKESIELSDSDFKTFENDIKRLAQGEPLQYIVEKAPFLDFYLRVNKHTLIPRPETELLVEKASQLFPKDTPLKIVDVGTGSGAIAIGLKRYFTQSEIIALDISAEALEIASINTQLHVINPNIDFWCVNCFELDAQAFTNLDLIVSNPPYIPPQDAHLLHTNVKDYEPSQALFAPDERGLGFYQFLTAQSIHWLKEGGYLLVEIHAPLLDEIISCFQKYFNITQYGNDYNHKPRWILAQKSKPIHK